MDDEELADFLCLEGSDRLWVENMGAGERDLYDKMAKMEKHFNSPKNQSPYETEQES